MLGVKLFNAHAVPAFPIERKHWGVPRNRLSNTVHRQAMRNLELRPSAGMGLTVLCRANIHIPIGIWSFLRVHGARAGNSIPPSLPDSIGVRPSGCIFPPSLLQSKVQPQTPWGIITSIEC